jgi:hypothetical protein
VPAIAEKLSGVEIVVDVAAAVLGFVIDGTVVFGTTSWAG